MATISLNENIFGTRGQAFIQAAKANGQNALDLKKDDFQALRQAADSYTPSGTSDDLARQQAALKQLR